MSMALPEWDRLEPSDLLLDSENPRLAQYGLSPRASQDELLQLIWEQMDCLELARSIASGGFWPHECLIGVRKGNKCIIIEGNRRLAAVLGLIDPSRVPKSFTTLIPPLNDEVLRSLEKLPVRIVEDRQDAWREIGFKHVNGPARWSSFAKAKYISEVHGNGEISLEDISAQLGDNHRTVQRLFRAYQVLDQAERNNVYRREHAYKGQLAFSHLMTGLDYDGIAEFISVKDRSEEDPNPVPPEKLSNLGELLTWMWGDRRSNTPPAIRSQNPDLRHLDKVVANAAATEVLRRENDIERAFEESKGDDVVFFEAITDARLALRRAQSAVTRGFSGETSLLEEVRGIAKMALDLLDTMKAKQTSDDDLSKRLNG